MGEDASKEADKEQLDDDEGLEESSVNRKGDNELKRSASPNIDSLKKHRKNPMVKIMKGILEHM